MKAANNPFRASRVGALRFRSEQSRAELLACAASRSYRGALVGPEGSGKSTLLAEIGRDLEGLGLDVVRLSWDEAGCLPRLLRTRGKIVLLDSAEKVPGPLLIGLVAFKRSGLLLTLHWRIPGIPILATCGVTAELVSSLVDELTSCDEAFRARAIALMPSKRGNVREIFGALYDVAKDSA